MSPQITGDVLKHFQSDQNSQQISKHSDQSVTEPVRILVGGDQGQRDFDRELNQGGNDDHSCDHGEKNGDLLFALINPLKEASTLATELGHALQLLLKGL